MKLISVLVVALLVATSAARAEILAVQIERQGTNVAYRLQSRPIDKIERKSTLTKLAGLSKTTPVHIQTTPSVTAADLVTLVSLVKTTDSPRLSSGTRLV